MIPQNFNLTHLDHSKIWITLQNSSIQGWNFGILGSSPTPLPYIPSEESHLQFINDHIRIKDNITGKVVFQLPVKYGKPLVAQWDGQCVVAGDRTGEVLILDFSHLYPQTVLCQSMIYH